MCVLILALMVSGQSAWAQSTEVKSCARSTPPQLDGVISQGEYVEDCQYTLQLLGPYLGNGTSPPPPLPKSMDLYAMNDRQNVYLAFHWTHLWNQDPAASDSSPDKYALFLAFDFNANGLFEDNDIFANTIDDALGLAYLGFPIGNPNPPSNAWIKLYIPVGLYVISWNVTAATDNAQVIGGPGPIPNTIWNGVKGPGPLDPNGSPVSFPYAASRSPSGKTSGLLYTYTVELVVPKVLFHRSVDLTFEPAGFGFFLSQETNSMDLWTWPSDISTWNWQYDRQSAELLGVLGDLVPGSTGFFNPGEDPPLIPVVPVGGAISSPDKLGIILPWLGVLALSAAVTVAASSRRRRK